MYRRRVRLLRLVVFLAAVVVGMLGSVQAEARKPSPRGALAVVAYPNGHPMGGYGGVERCPTCSFFYFWETASPAPYDLADSGDGRLLLAFSDRSTLRLDSYDPASYRRVSTRHATFPGWQIGDVLFGPDGNVYVLLGRGNEGESKTKNVIQVRKLNRSLVASGVARIDGGFDELGIYQPFEATDSSMALVGSTLIVHTARLIFHIARDWAPHHQVNLSFAVDTTTMAASTVQAPYASHSFRQFVRPHGLDAVFADHGDGYPRALQIGVVGDLFGPLPNPVPPDGAPNCPETGDPTPAPPECEMQQPSPRFDTYKALTFPGKTGDNSTGATVNGFEVGTNDALSVGLSVPIRRRVRANGGWIRLVPNAYAISTNLVNGKSRFAWLTRYPPRAERWSVGQPALVPLGGDRFAVLFTTELRRRPTLRYALLDETGRVVARKSWPGRRFAGVAQPSLVGTKLFWVGFWRAPGGPYTRSGDLLYGLDLRDPRHPRLLSR